MSSSLTKLDIIKSLSERYRKYGVTVATVRRIVAGVFDELSKALTGCRKIEIRNFGVFRSVDRAPRVARNPRTGEKIPIGARKSVKFILGRELVSKLSKVPSTNHQPSPPPP
jgi:nucleoid DNA-binding protein